MYYFIFLYLNGMIIVSWYKSLQSIINRARRETLKNSP